MALLGRWRWEDYTSVVQGKCSVKKCVMMIEDWEGSVRDILAVRIDTHASTLRLITVGQCKFDLLMHSPVVY